MSNGLSDYERGQWHAFDSVLFAINTFDTKLVTKGALYDMVMEMRPVQDAPEQK